jgi:hypothetical protein
LLVTSAPRIGPPPLPLNGRTLETVDAASFTTPLTVPTAEPTVDRTGWPGRPAVEELEPEVDVPACKPGTPTPSDVLAPPLDSAVPTPPASWPFVAAPVEPLTGIPLALAVPCPLNCVDAPCVPTSELPNSFPVTPVAAAAATPDASTSATTAPTANEVIGLIEVLLRARNSRASVMWT